MAQETTSITKTMKFFGKPLVLVEAIDGSSCRHCFFFKRDILDCWAPDGFRCGTGFWQPDTNCPRCGCTDKAVCAKCIGGDDHGN